jgi:hypothetical protein
MTSNGIIGINLWPSKNQLSGRVYKYTSELRADELGISNGVFLENRIFYISFSTTLFMLLFDKPYY